MIPILNKKLTGLREPDITEEEQKTLDLENKLHGLRHLLKEIDIDMDKLMVFVEANSRPLNFTTNPAFFTISHEIKDQCASRRDMPDNMENKLRKIDDFTRRSIITKGKRENWTDLDYVKFSANQRLLRRAWSHWCIQFA